MTRMGLQLAGFSYPVPDEERFERAAAVAAAGEEAGFDSLWVMDHFMQIPPIGGPEQPMLEGYTLLAALSQRTSSARLGTLVTGVNYRNPALLAKIVTTLDVVSGGRAILGIGASWFEAEHQAYGFRFPPTRERLDRLEEALRICRALFSEPSATVEGEHFSIRGAHNVPRPLTPGGPPILVGGGGERRTLRLVAEHADICNLFGNPEDIPRKLTILDRHCEDVGRDPGEITRTTLQTLVVAATAREAERKREALREAWGMPRDAFDSMVTAGDVDGVAEQIAAYRDAGIEGVIVNIPDDYELEPVALAGKAIAAGLGG